MRAKFAMLVGVACVGALLMIPAGASAQAPAAQAPAPALDITEQVTCVDCTVELVRVTNAGGTMNAVLEVTNEATGQTQRVSTPITVQQQGGTCLILEITIPPIDIFLLGIRIQTDTIHIRITAQRGTLLGDLLCGLFFPDRGGPAQNQLVAALNEALRREAATVVPTG
jgi:hypothetical protein